MAEEEDFVTKLQRKCRQDPLVPMGCLATVAMLTGGLYSFRLGQPLISQQFMRARVLAQAATVTVLGVGTFMLGGGTPSSSSRPSDHAEQRVAAEIDPATLRAIEAKRREAVAAREQTSKGMVDAVRAARAARAQAGDK